MADAKPKNIYQKIQQVRYDLATLKLKKSGKNTYSNFMYYELSDFLPSLNRLMNEQGLMSRFVIQPAHGEQKEKAVLEIFNADNPEEKLVFYNETAEVKIGTKADGSGGAEPIQNLGGKITYMRRYMMMIAFEISENDLTDSLEQNGGLKLSDAQIEEIQNAPNQQELADVCNRIKKEMGPTFQRVVLAQYTKRKVQLETMAKEKTV